MSEPDANAQLWEAHADWWQREFTDGVDPEYTEQIIPLILEWTLAQLHHIQKHVGVLECLAHGVQH